jgi:hypothetical protein
MQTCSGVRDLFVKLLINLLIYFIYSNSWGSKEDTNAKQEELVKEVDEDEVKEEEAEEEDEEEEEDVLLEEEEEEEEKKKKRRKEKPKKRKRNPLLPSIIYAGHRQLLPLDHWLRSFGQSRRCCPIDYYDNKKNEVRRSFFTTKKIDENKNPSAIWVDEDTINGKPFCNSKCCGNEKITFGGEKIVWNDQSDVVNLQTFLYYHHCDYRRCIPYKRITNAEYLRDGCIAKDLNKKRNQRKNEKESNIQKPLSIQEKGTVKSVNGVKGIWAFASLPYCDICENICYDPFHVFKNVIFYIFSYLLGKRIMSLQVRNFCRNTLSHPSLTASNSGAVWELGQSDYKNIEKLYFKSVVLSKGTVIIRFIDIILQII